MEDIKKEALKFIEECVQTQKNSFVSSGDVVKGFLPFLFSKGMTDKITFNTLPKLSDFFKEVLREQFDFGTWSVPGEDCENCKGKTKKTYRDCFRDCVVNFDDNIYETAATKEAHECKVAPKEIDNAKLDSVLTALHMRIRELDRRVTKLEDGRTGSTLMY